MLSVDQIDKRTPTIQGGTDMTDYEALSRAYDIYQIKNVMGHHAYHHALGTHRQELDRDLVRPGGHLLGQQYGASGLAGTPCTPIMPTPKPFRMKPR